MKKDTLNRRNRFAGRQPTGKRIELGERDFLYFAALERHGPLPATYLYEFSKSAARNHKGHQQRLTDLFNEDNTPHRGPYLDRPDPQFASVNARYQSIAYEHTPLAATALRDRDIGRQAAMPPSGPYLHRFMTACLTASIELAVRKAGYTFITSTDILNHPKCPEKTRESRNPLAIPLRDTAVIPDQLFGIDYGGKFRFFALESDRKTETIVSRNRNGKAFGTRLEAYAEIIESEAHRRIWGIPSLTVLTVTTSLAHMHTMISHLEDSVSAKTAARFLFKTKPDFGKYWTVPPVMTDIFEDPWERTASPLSIGTP